MSAPWNINNVLYFTPVLAGETNNEVKHFSEVDCISIIIYGGTTKIGEAFNILQKAGEKRKIKGEARIIAAVNSFPGEDIPLEYWTLRACLL